MAKLAVSLSSQENQTTRTRSRVLESSQSNETPTSSSVKIEALRSKSKPHEKFETQCIGECSAKSNKWLEENTRLSTNITQLRHDMAEQNAELEKLRTEKQRLQEVNTEICDTNETLCDDIKHLRDESEKLKKEIKVMREKLQSLANEKQAPQSSSIYDTQLEQIASALTIAQTSLKVIQENKSKAATRTENLLELPQDTEISTRTASAMHEDTAETTKNDADHMKLKLDSTEIGSSKPLSDTLKAVKAENAPAKTMETESRTSEQENQETEVKIETEELPTYYEYVPGNFDSAINIDDDEEQPKKNKGKKFADSLDDITFFSKPPAGTQKSKLNERLNRALSKKPSQRTVQVKSDILNPITEKTSSKAQVKRELFDENSNREVKQEPSKKRKALAPVFGLTNRKLSSANSKAKKGTDKTFDFVEKPVLIEQSRLATNSPL